MVKVARTKTDRNQASRFLILLFSLSAIVSCGGGGGSQPETVEPPVVENTDWDSITWDSDNWQ